MAQDLDKSPAQSFDLVYEGPTVGWQKMYGGGGGGSGGTSDYWVNVRDFAPDPNAFGHGFTDDTDVIQAAINFAFNNGKTAVRFPDNSYCTIRKSIWLAPPGSYNSVDPSTGGSFTEFQFAMSLIGDEVDGNGLYVGVTIEAYGETAGVIDYDKNCSYPVIISGPGQGMRIVGLNIRGGHGSLWPNTYDSRSIGIAISGGSGGASRTIVERCWIQRMHAGIKTGWNEDSLADSNTFIKCVIDDCYYGYYYGQTQNYINELISCNCGAVEMVYSPVGKAVNIYGGNYSKGGGILLDFDISGTTALTETSPGSGDWRLTTTITFSGSDYFGFSKNGFTDNPSFPVYTTYAFETAHFGMVPCDFISFNAGTNALTVRINQTWLLAQYGQSPDLTLTDISAELQACTVLPAGQRITSFHGPGIHVYGVHLESPGSIYTLLNNGTGFNGDRLASIENLMFNWTPSQDGSTLFRKLQSVWPLVDVSGSGGVRFKGGQWTASQGNIPYLFSTTNSSPIIFENTSILTPNVWCSSNSSTMVNNGSIYSRGLGAGEWLPNTPHAPPKFNVAWGGASGGGVGWVQNGRGRYRAVGHMPEPDSILELNSSWYAVVSGSLAAATPLEYPIICGQTPYRITDWNNGAPNLGQIVISNHNLFSYGKNLSINWSYKGQSNCLYCDNINLLFAGLKIGIDNGSGVAWYVITGTYTTATYVDPKPGYVTVVGENNNSQPSPLAGTKTVVYTGSTISQEAYSFTQYALALKQPLATLTDAANIAVSMLSSINFQVTLGGNRTLSNPTNTTVGQTGTIEVIQDGTGGRTLAFDTNYKYQSASAPSLNAGASAKTILNYWVENSTNIWISGGYQPSTANSMQTGLVTTQFDRTNNNTLADVPGLSATLLAGRKYRGRATLYTNVNATPGMKVGMAFTGTVNTYTAHALPYIGATTISNGTLVTTLGQVASGNSGFTVIEMSYYIDVNAAGTLTVTFSQGTSGGTTVSVLVGSNMVTTLI